MCPGGVLKEITAENTVGVSEIVSVEYCNNNVDNKQYYNGTNHGKSDICDTCGQVFASSRNL